MSKSKSVRKVVDQEDKRAFVEPESIVYEFQSHLREWAEYFVLGETVMLSFNSPVSSDSWKIAMLAGLKELGVYMDDAVLSLTQAWYAQASKLKLYGTVTVPELAKLLAYFWITTKFSTVLDCEDDAATREVYIDLHKLASIAVVQLLSDDQLSATDARFCVKIIESSRRGLTDVVDERMLGW